MNHDIHFARRWSRRNTRPPSLSLNRCRWRYQLFVFAASYNIISTPSDAFRIPSSPLALTFRARRGERSIICHRTRPEEVLRSSSDEGTDDGFDKGIGIDDHSDQTSNVDAKIILQEDDVDSISLNSNATTNEDNNVIIDNIHQTKNTKLHLGQWIIPFAPRKRKAAPTFLFPWSLWMKIRSSIDPLQHFDSQSSSSSSSETSTKRTNKKRRWEIPLTSKPFEGVEDLRSTTVTCIAAIALYFVIGTLAFPLWLEPSWTFIDALYFSMVSLTTVGYGDVVVSSGTGPRTMMAKFFAMTFNVYAVCISVSALGIIAKLALAQEHKLVTRAKERARRQFIQMFDSENDEEEDDLEEEDENQEQRRAETGEKEEEREQEQEEEDEDNEQCTWAEQVGDDNCVEPNKPRTVFGALLQSLRNNVFDFAVLAVLAKMLQKVEGWSFTDVLYYWNCTATTIGYGDVCPQTQIGRLLAVAFVPLSVVTLGEVIASVFAFVGGRVSAKAEKDFLRREITFSDLQYLDVNDDGRVCELDFVTFMLVAMQKVDRSTMRDLRRLFHAMDAGKNGFIEKEDLITLRQRKRFSRRLKRERRKEERWFETRLTKENRNSRRWFGWSF